MDKKILVAFYSLQGHTKKVAETLKEQTSADLFEILPKKPYKSPSVYVSGIADIKKGVKPELSTHTSIEEYEIIFVGSPVWFGTFAPPILTFLDENNFSEKSVAPFCCFKGSAGKFPEDFAKNCSAEKILGTGEFREKDLMDDSLVEKAVSDWLAEIFSVN